MGPPEVPILPGLDVHSAKMDYFRHFIAAFSMLIAALDAIVAHTPKSWKSLATSMSDDLALAGMLQWLLHPPFHNHTAFENLFAALSEQTGGRYRLLQGSDAKSTDLSILTLTNCLMY